MDGEVYEGVQFQEESISANQNRFQLIKVMFGVVRTPNAPERLSERQNHAINRIQ